MRRCQNFILNYSGKWGSGDTWEIPGKGNRTAKLGSLRTNFVWRTAPLSAWLMPRIQGWWWGDPKGGAWRVTRPISWRASSGFIQSAMELLFYTCSLPPWAQHSYDQLNQHPRMWTLSSAHEFQERSQSSHQLGTHPNGWHKAKEDNDHLHVCLWVIDPFSIPTSFRLIIWFAQTRYQYTL